MQTIWATPTRAEIEALKVGDEAPTCFGTKKRVTEIFARGVDVEGKLFVCYYTETGAGFGQMSMSMKEGEDIAVI